MAAARSHQDTAEREVASGVPLPGELEAGMVDAWEQIENGRYMPRRIRGSMRGRELG